MWEAAIKNCERVAYLKSLELQSPRPLPRSKIIQLTLIYFNEKTFKWIQNRYCSNKIIWICTLWSALINNKNSLKTKKKYRKYQKATKR